MSIRATLAPAAVATLLVTGCANNPFQPPAHEAAIKTYYEAHASERNGRCKAPYIDGFTRVDVVEETAELMVVEARYLYRDWIKDRETSESGRQRSECVAFNSRRFVLIKDRGRLQVAEMSAPERG